MLKRTFQLFLFAFLISGASWAADDPFLGKWKLNSSKSMMVDQMKVDSLGANKYSFDFGSGGEPVLVDGTDQPGNFGTTLAVSVESPESWKVIRKQNGRTMISAIWTISKDGNSLTDDFTYFKPDGTTTNTKYHYKRTAGGPGFAATWVTSSQMTREMVMEVRSFEGDGLSFIAGSEGQIMNVKFDGKDYASTGPNAVAGSAASGKRISARSLEITRKLNDKPVVKEQIEISSDGKTLTMARRVIGQSEPTVMVFDKQ